jgi:hypothetical protein
VADNRLPLLLLLAAGLGAVLWWDMQTEPEPAEVIAAASPARHGESRSEEEPPPAFGGMANPLASLDKDSLHDLTGRPLFTPSRRPPPVFAPPQEATALAPPPAPPATPDYTLVGVIRDGDRAIALLRSRSDGRNLRVEAGDTVRGWEVAAVEARSVRLKRSDGAAHELRLAPR